MNIFSKNNYSNKEAHSKGLHIVALFEGAKGMLVLLVGFELLSFLHRDLHEAARQLVKHLHMNPASHYPRIFLDLVGSINDTRLWGLALAAAAYSAIRFVEAGGLWYRKKWAEWFAVLSGGLYVPVEIYEVIQRQSWPRVTLLVVNISIVAYLLFILFCNGRKATS